MKFDRLITTLDYHHGQASRTIMSGYPPILGATMAEKARYYDDHLAWIHESLLREPRGHAGMLGSILTDPVDAESAVGVIFLHPQGQFEMCGDSTFATAFAVLESGIVTPTEPETRFTIDTVAGPVDITAQVEGGVVQHVAMTNVPSFYLGRVVHDIEGVGEVTIDVAYGGNQYAILDAQAIGLTASLEHSERIIRTGMKILDGDQAILSSLADDRSKGQIDLVAFSEDVAGQDHTYRVAIVYRPGLMPRSPSGTGMSSQLALRYFTGDLALNEPAVQHGVLGTSFSGRVVEEVESDGKPAIITEIGAKSHLMGIHQFVIADDDPFRHGFTMEVSNRQDLPGRLELSMAQN